jgi:hypothetical protein
MGPVGCLRPLPLLEVEVVDDKKGFEDDFFPDAAL